MCLIKGDGYSSYADNLVPSSNCIPATIRNLFTNTLIGVVPTKGWTGLHLSAEFSMIRLGHTS